MTLKLRRSLPGGRRSGWSLIELVAAMMLLTILMGLVTAALVGSLQTQKASAGAFNTIAFQSALTDRFREDAAGAKAAPEKWRDLSRTPSCLILEFANDKHIMYRWHQEQLIRSTFAGSTKTEQFVPVSESTTLVEFSSTGTTTPALVTLRVKGRAALEVSAALGGDNR
jgi:type II secretory pathway pseudopilin PulG